MARGAGPSRLDGFKLSETRTARQCSATRPDGPGPARDSDLGSRPGAVACSRASRLGIRVGTIMMAVETSRRP